MFKVKNNNSRQIGQNQKSKIVMIVVIIFACFGVFGFGRYYLWNSSKVTQNMGSNSNLLPKIASITPIQRTNPTNPNALQYEIDLPKSWETGYKRDKETSRIMTMYDDSKLSNITLYRNHKPKTNEADKDVVNSYGSLFDLSLVEVVVASAKLEDEYQTWQDVFNKENQNYEAQQKKLAVMKSKGEDPCGPWWQDIKPRSIQIGSYIALNLPYKAFCQYEGPIPSEYIGVWKIFPSSSSKEYVFIEYSYSQNNQTASESVKQLELAIKGIKIIGNKV